MADTQRTRAALLALFADNVTGQISAQDLRDYLVTVMNAEFKYEGDFWARPLPDNMTDKTGRGTILYSQITRSACSFGNVVYLTLSNEWGLANASASATGGRGKLGIVLNTYAAADSQCQVLLRGLVYNSAWSARGFTSVGLPLYLLTDSTGSISVTMLTSTIAMVSQAVVGYVVAGVGSANGMGVLEFHGNAWGICGA